MAPADLGTAILRRIAALLLLCTASLASAHPAPFSFLDVQMEQGAMRGTLTIHDFDAAHELKIGQPDLLRDVGLAARARGPLIAIVERRVHLTGDGKAIKLQWGAIEVLAERQSVRLPFTISGALPGQLDIEARLFPYDSSHQSFVNIYEAGQLRQQSILDAAQPRMRFYGGTPQGRWAVITTFVAAGIHHILIGPDHILFLLGLLLLGGTLRRLAAIVTAFTLGHSITLSLAALGVVRLSPMIVEPVIALSIIVVGVDNLLVSRQRTASTVSASSPSMPRDLRTWMAAVFGLVHGFGFASVLIQFGLPREALLWSLAAFNAGVEVGQLIIVVGLIALARGVAFLRIGESKRLPRMVPLASIAIVAAGLYWFIERTIFAPTA